MAIKTRDELMAQISARIGDDTSDDAIALIEDVTDTLADLETRANGDGTDWKAEAERIDKEWRDKYISRFTTGESADASNTNNVQVEEKKYTYDELFK